MFFGIQSVFRGVWLSQNSKQKYTIGERVFFVSPVTRLSARRVASRRWSTTATGCLHACGVRTDIYASHSPTRGRRRTQVLHYFSLNKNAAPPRLLHRFRAALLSLEVYLFFSLVGFPKPARQTSSSWQCWYLSRVSQLSIRRATLPPEHSGQVALIFDVTPQDVRRGHLEILDGYSLHRCAVFRLYMQTSVITATIRLRQRAKL